MAQEKSAATLKFEDAVFKAMAHFFPEKNLGKDDVPYDEVRTAVGKFIKDYGVPGTIQQASSSQAEEDKPKCEKSDETGTSKAYEEKMVTRQMAMPKESKEAASSERDAAKNAKFLKKLSRIRTDRRTKLEENTESIDLDCGETELSAAFEEIYDKKIIHEHKTALECYQLVLNTLRQYFTRHTWSDNIDNLTNEFLMEHVLKDCKDLARKYDWYKPATEVDERIRDYETMTLLEIYVLKNEPERIEKSQICNRLYFITYTMGAERMKTFLDMAVCDLFAHIIPKELGDIYEELCVDLPPDLEDLLAPEEQTSTKPTSSQSSEQRRGGRKSNPNDGSRKSSAGDGNRKTLPSEFVVPELTMDVRKLGARARRRSSGPGDSPPKTPVKKVGYLSEKVHMASRISKRLAEQKKKTGARIKRK